MSATLSADFSKHYPRGATIEAAFEQPADRFSVTVLFGPSGCGKTTILRCLAGLERPERGYVRFGGETWFDAATRTFCPPQRRGVGLLFQDFALFPHMTVAGNIGYGLKSSHQIHRARTSARDESRGSLRSRVSDMLDMLQLTGLEHRYPHQLSGGQQQRVALARAVIRRPRLLLLDEPLSSLDAPTRETLRRGLRHLLAGFGSPCFVVTHDRLEAMALGDYAIVLDEGKVRQSGPLEEVFSKPADLHVARMVGVETVTTGRIVQVENGLATVAVGSAELQVVTPEKITGPVYVCIRGEDVTLQTDPPAHSSARNQLRARVVSLTTDGPLVRVHLHCGFDLVALVTKPSLTELSLQKGTEVTALIKAPAIHVIPRN
jgi:molybdate transport system ATP-binding protein